MTQPHIVHLESLDALRAAAGAWDDLWQRSDVTLPSLRAELLAQWIEQFARPADFHAVVVESEGRYVAALPLVRRRLGKRGTGSVCRDQPSVGARPEGALHKRCLSPFFRLLDAAGMPCNEWSASGELLLDASVEQAGMPALQTLATGIRELPWPLLWFDEAVLDAPRWQGLQQAFLHAGMSVAEHPRWQVGRVAIDHDWPAYKARWPRKHRQQMAQAARRLAQEGEVRLAVHSQLSPDDVASPMQQCFEIEDRSWKGAAGGSVLRTPGMAEFFLRQARQAAQWGQLDLAMLHCGDRPVAFSYGLSAKGVFHSLKTGYDPDFARQHPGQLMRYYLLEQLFADPTRKWLDFLGEMTESHAAWLPQCYTVGRLAVAPRGGLGRLAVWGYKNVWWRYRRIAREKSGSSRCR
jgi:hypothetical protein